MKKFLSFVLVSLIGTSVFAQDKGIKQNGFWDNWFLEFQVGGSYTFSEYLNKTNVSNLITPHGALSFGKYFSPQAGARIQIGGWESKSYLPTTHKTYSYNYFQTNLDGLANLTNIFLSYREDRALNLYGILGVGYLHGFKNSAHGVKTSNDIIPRLGFQADLQTSKAVSINLEVVGNLIPDDFNGYVSERKYDATLNALVGLTYHFPTRGFKVITAADPAEIQSLNDKLNERHSALLAQQGELDNYRERVDDLEKKLAQKPKKEIVKQVNSETVLNAVVVFHLGSSVLEENQEINIYNAAKYLKENPDVKVIVTGYADKSTGNATINQRLSEKRAQAVADILSSKYGISLSRIKTQASGDKTQLFEVNEWNRVVIFTAQ